jgi:hypothetical protein
VARSNAEEGLNLILNGIDVLAEMALNPDMADDIAACEIKLRQLISRTQLILHFIEARRPRPTTITGRMN